MLNNQIQTKLHHKISQILKNDCDTVSKLKLNAKSQLENLPLISDIKCIFENGKREKVLISKNKDNIWKKKTFSIEVFILC